MKLAAVKYLFLILVTTLTTSSYAESIRVRIKKAETTLQFSGSGIQISQKDSGLMPASLAHKMGMQIRIKNVLKRWPTWVIKWSGIDQPTEIVGDKLFISADDLTLGENRVPHTIELSKNSVGQIDVIAELDLEKYLTGVLPSEMPASWPREALKAQAVASRSYALAILHERKDQPFHVESSILDQVFEIKNHVSARDGVRLKIADIVRATQGQVLVDNEGRTLKAHYHADCGGATETAKSVWGDQVQESGTTKDAQCPLSPLARWKFKIARAELSEMLAEFYGLGPGIILKSLAIMGRTPSARVSDLAVLMTDGIPRSLRSHEFRRIIGFNALKSTNFDIFWANKEVIFEGRGHGHGVGMCQYGARQLAVRGLQYDGILKNYFPNARVAQITPKLTKQL